ncbi:hypothetical protein DMH97_19225 [Salmonella enterica]|nr:hypothetical protein [Salmonella enterica]
MFMQDTPLDMLIKIIDRYDRLLDLYIIHLRFIGLINSRLRLLPGNTKWCICLLNLLNPPHQNQWQVEGLN